jgi:hypothetical protein
MDRLVSKGAAGRPRSRSGPAVWTITSRSLAYDLVFWLQDQVATSDEASLAYEALCEQRPVLGLLPFPVEEFLARLATVFPDAVREPNGEREWVVWESNNSDASFQVEWSPVHVLATLRPLVEDHGNRLIEIAAEFNAPLYDPQIGERFGAT